MPCTGPRLSPNTPSIHWWAFSPSSSVPLKMQAQDCQVLGIPNHHRAGPSPRAAKPWKTTNLIPLSINTLLTQNEPLSYTVYYSNSRVQLPQQSHRPMRTLRSAINTLDEPKPAILGLRQPFHPKTNNNPYSYSFSVKRWQGWQAPTWDIHHSVTGNSQSYHLSLPR